MGGCCVGSSEDLGPKLFRKSDSVSTKSYWHAKRWNPDKEDRIFVGHPCTGVSMVAFASHLIRTGCDLSFSDFERVVPWIQAAYDCDINLGSRKVAKPHLFITHQRLEAIHKGAKYIVCIRDPADVIISHNALIEWNIRRGAGHWQRGGPKSDDFEQIFRERLLHGFDGVSILDHIVDAYHARCRDDVVLVSFEGDIVTRRNELYRKLMKHLGVPFDQKEFDRVCSLGTIAYMVSHLSKFENKYHARRQREKRLRGVRPPLPHITDRPARLSMRRLKKLRNIAQKIWTEYVVPRIGIRSYSELLEVLQNSKGKAWRPSGRETKQAKLHSHSEHEHGVTISTEDHHIHTEINTDKPIGEKKDVRPQPVETAQAKEDNMITPNSGEPPAAVPSAKDVADLEAVAEEADVSPERLSQVNNRKHMGAITDEENKKAHDLMRSLGSIDVAPNPAPRATPPRANPLSPDTASIMSGSPAPNERKPRKLMTQASTMSNASILSEDFHARTEVDLPDTKDDESKDEASVMSDVDFRSPRERRRSPGKSPVGSEGRRTPKTGTELWGRERKWDPKGGIPEQMTPRNTSRPAKLDIRTPSVHDIPSVHDPGAVDVTGNQQFSEITNQVPRLAVANPVSSIRRQFSQ
ncbi:hypothetical protein AAMO2058_001066600 [Amorphochlora amoebiformis]|uniref:Sulfotransferase domain-containing protein n=1 Tax=Amorphochlora amoebiformis TaxID=1561963 RepID=A0A7S0H3H2_9EUKA|mmetsp:Transcript_26276/g.41552  ORF Transcript_26276/g.41552 Transcript_26276/m.41552 type:complete len:636 (+) Transcript_26276:28-1935(+)